MTPAARATRIVRSVPAIARSGVEDVGQETADPGGAGGELQAPIAELDDRDRGEEGALPGRIGLDVALDEGRVRAGRPGGAAPGAPTTKLRVSSHRPQPGRPYRMRSGRGLSEHLGRDCTRGVLVGRLAGLAGWPGWPVGRAQRNGTGRRGEARRPCRRDGARAGPVPSLARGSRRRHAAQADGVTRRLTTARGPG